MRHFPIIIYCLALLYLRPVIRLLPGLDGCARGPKNESLHLHTKNTRSYHHTPAVVWPSFTCSARTRSTQVDNNNSSMGTVRATVCTATTGIAIIIIACHNIKSAEFANRWNRHWLSIVRRSHGSAHEAIKWRLPIFFTFDVFSLFSLSTGGYCCRVPSLT